MSVNECVDVSSPLMGNERSESPVSGWWFWRQTFAMNSFRLFIYYLGMTATISVNLLIFFYSNWHGFVSVTEYQWLQTITNIIKYLALLSIPSLTFTFIGHILFPPVLRRQVASLEELSSQFHHRLFFRIVTRGTNKSLVKQHVKHSWCVLSKILPSHQFFIEVATDNSQDFIATDVEEVMMMSSVRELVVPKEYQTSTGAKYKARALQYAIEHSAAKEDDWIVHLDEETRFDAETVRHILHHCVTESDAIQRDEKKYGNIGQGTILYGTNEIDNYVTTLADSVRVGDDLGKFRLQYELHEPLIGMHGSFVVCHNAVEKEVTFDHGMEGSITEDAYFALIARWQKGVKFSWIDAFMYEQSPFTFGDFMRQRCRWYVGLWLVCMSNAIPVKGRMTLTFFMCTWASTPLIWIALVLNIFIDSDISYGYRMVTSVMAGVSTWGYIVGFLFTFRMRDGIMRYLGLAILQYVCLPLFAILEMSGVLLGIFRPPVTAFHVVQKEKNPTMDPNCPLVLSQSNSCLNEIVVTLEGNVNQNETNNEVVIELEVGQTQK